MTPQHCLVPIDLSEYSLHALEYAVELAGRLHARLTLLHGMQSLPVGGADMGVTLPYASIENLEEELRRSLESHQERLTAKGLQSTVAVVHGVPFQEIIDLAGTRQVDLIILGTHGRTGIRHVLLGSVAEKVVRLAPCPVLVTRRPADIAT